MVSQAVAEGILRFILERNGLPTDQKEDKNLEDIVRRQIISQECSDAFQNIRKAFRNDVHHMNPSVSKADFPPLAKRCIDNLAMIECEIFACGFEDGQLVPRQPKYWDVTPEGTVPVFLRIDK